MIKRTLYFSNPSYLSYQQGQLVLRLPEVEKNDTLPVSFKKEATATIPIEDICVVVLDHSQITITQVLLAELLKNNAAIITCDESHMPIGLQLPLDKNSEQNKIFRAQLASSLPLRKQLWQQTASAKIRNQAELLRRNGHPIENMLHWAASVKSGDTENHEGRAAAYHWATIFPSLPQFKRGRKEEPPNNLLNYGYAILRAVVARALVSSGLMPIMGIHHHNKANAYCLADDMMEPYRPFVDEIVLSLVNSGANYTVLSIEIKKSFLELLTRDVRIGGQTSPLLNAVQRTSSSLVDCYLGHSKTLLFPQWP
ncbi:MAG: type II CRISPR-associated endonuclease Cas1 [Bacteroidia bacterium]